MLNFSTVTRLPTLKVGVSAQMIWAITITIFVGTVIAVLLLFSSISSWRERFREGRERRTEGRTPAELDVELRPLDDETPTHEMALIINVSCHGARVVTTKAWRPNDRVLVRLAGRDEHSPAKIAYCQPLPRDVFIIGLQFPSAFDNWAISGSGMPNVSPHVFRK